MRRHPRGQHAALLPAVVLLLGLVSIAALTHASPARAGRHAQADSSPTPTVTPSPPDAELAATFARNGKYDAAVGAYLALVDQAAQGDRLNARLQLAQLYIEDEQLPVAIAQLEAYLLEAPADVSDARFLLAEALAQQGGWDAAIPLYDAYIDADAGASTYARIGRAEALARAGRVFDAVADAQRALDADLPASARIDFMLTMAEAVEGSLPEVALVWYELIRRETAVPAEEALAYWRSAKIREELGDTAATLDAWVEIIERYPESPTAQGIIDEPPVLKILLSLDSYYTGLVYYRAGRTQEARESFESSLQTNLQGGDRSLAARASYYLALIDESGGDMDAAVAAYKQVVTLDPDSQLADDALWWQGRLLEQTDRATAAAIRYETLTAEYSRSEWAPEARFRLALLDYDGGRYEDAATAFADIADEAFGQERWRGLLWQGKALSVDGERAAADAIWRTLDAEAPAEYYGLRAAVLVGDSRGELADAGLDEAQMPEWSEIEAWLIGAVDASPSEWLEASVQGEHWLVGRELSELGMGKRANAEFSLVLEGAGADVPKLYQIARYFQTTGLPHVSSRAAARLLAAVSEEGAAGAPLDLWRLAYPAPFEEPMREAADDFRVSDLLLLAMVRQESFFDPLAGSPAGALGLTQVIPETGAVIALDEGLLGFETADLYRPAVSLDFGASYLADQLETFDGNFYFALAAYNGGPTNAVRWAQAAAGDVDRVVAEIDFGQTVAYVRLVSENLARYRQLYQGLDEPSLPAD